MTVLLNDLITQYLILVCFCIATSFTLLAPKAFLHILYHTVSISQLPLLNDQVVYQWTSATSRWSLKEHPNSIMFCSHPSTASLQLFSQLERRGKLFKSIVGKSLCYIDFSKVEGDQWVGRWDRTRVLVNRKLSTLQLHLYSFLLCGSWATTLAEKLLNSSIIRSTQGHI